MRRRRVRWNQRRADVDRSARFGAAAALTLVLVVLLVLDVAVGDDDILFSVIGLVGFCAWTGVLLLHGELRPTELRSLAAQKRSARDRDVYTGAQCILQS